MSSGIIMRNGIQYGNAVLNKADEILTDDNKTVQDELNTLKTSLNWYKVGEASGNSTIPLPSNWQELKVVTYHQSSKRTFDTTILKLFADIDTNTKYFYDGDFETSSSSNGCGWTCSTTHINCFLLYLNGSSDLANSKTYLYAR